MYDMVRVLTRGFNHLKSPFGDTDIDFDLSRLGDEVNEQFMRLFQAKQEVCR